MVDGAFSEIDAGVKSYELENPECVKREPPKTLMFKQAQCENPNPNRSSYSGLHIRSKLLQAILDYEGNPSLPKEKVVIASSYISYGLFIVGATLMVLSLVCVVLYRKHLEHQEMVRKNEELERNINELKSQLQTRVSPSVSAHHASTDHMRSPELKPTRRHQLHVEHRPRCESNDACFLKSEQQRHKLDGLGLKRCNTQSD